MSAIALLLGLLVVAFVGSQLIGRRASAYRLPSGGEYLLLGMALGPHALGAVEHSTLSNFEPLAAVGTAWLTLVVGADYGYQGRRRVSARGIAAGVLLSGVSALVIAVAVFFAASHTGLFAGRDLWFVAVGVGLVGCETTRHAVGWVLKRHSADGPLSRLVDDLADADDLVPIAGLAVLMSFTDHPDVSLVLPWWGWTLATVGVGFLLGATATALLRSEPRASDGWGVIIGAVLLTVGAAWRLGLALQAATFTLGVALSILSRHRRELRYMLVRSEQAVLLPMLLLSGASVVLDRPLGPAALLAVAFTARVVVRLLAAPILVALAGVPQRVAPLLGVGLLPSGALSISIGLAISTRIHGTVGNTVLATAVGLTLIGETIGPAALRRALEAAGEISEDAEPRLSEDRISLPEPSS